MSGDRAIAANDEAFVVLVRRHSQFAFQVAFAVLRNVQDAEDVVQETFLKIYKSRDWLNIRDDKAFLARAAWRLAVDRMRRSPVACFTQESQDGTPDAETALIKADLEATVHRLIDALPAELRLPLALSTVDEMTSPEIAKVMHLSEGTVRTRLARARKILKQKLAELEVRRG